MYAEDRVYSRETLLNIAVKVALNSGEDPLELAKAYEAWVTEPVKGDTERPAGVSALGHILPT